MVKSVQSISASGAPVKTIELLDPRTRTVRKFTNTPEAVDKYLKDAKKAEKELIKHSSFTAGTVGVAGFCAQLLYDGIKRSKFYPSKAIASGIFMGLVSFAATALFNYKTKICKIADNFMEESENRFMQKGINGEKFPDYVNRVAKEKEIKEEEETKPLEPDSKEPITDNPVDIESNDNLSADEDAKNA